MWKTIPRRSAPGAGRLPNFQGATGQTLRAERVPVAGGWHVGKGEGAAPLTLVLVARPLARVSPSWLGTLETLPEPQKAPAWGGVASRGVVGEEG